MSEETWLGYRQAAERAGVTVRQLRTWRNVGIRGVRLEGRVDPVSGRWEVKEEDLMAMWRWASGQRSKFGKHVQPARRGKGTA